MPRWSWIEGLLTVTSTPRPGAGEAGPPVVLVSDVCGRTLDQEFICWGCDVTVTPGQIRSRHPRGDYTEVERN